MNTDNATAPRSPSFPLRYFIRGSPPTPPHSHNLTPVSRLLPTPEGRAPISPKIQPQTGRFHCDTKSPLLRACIRLDVDDGLVN